MKILLALVLALTLTASACAEAVSDLTDDGLVRVRLDSLGDVKTLTLEADGSYALDGSPALRLRDGAKITAEAESGHVLLHVGGLVMDMGEGVTFARRSDGGMKIAETGRDNLYPGDLALAAEGDALTATLTANVEDYLKGVVPYEMSDSFPVEALKAQAVAARTYAMQRKRASGGRDYDLSDTTADQVFRGVNEKHKNAAAAVEATRGVVGLWQGEFAACYYTASNGGLIALPEEIWGGACGYIEKKEDPYDLENPRSLVSELSFSADLSDCAGLKKLLGEEVGEVLDVTVEGRTAVFTTDEGEISLDVYDDLKDKLHLGLNRRDYERADAEKTEDGFTLRLRGFGHCAGMSQRGAQQMAQAHGMKYAEILEFYYPGLEFEKIGWAEPEQLWFGTVTAGVLNVRGEPSVKAGILGRLEKGRTVTFSGSGEWLNVRADGFEVMDDPRVTGDGYYETSLLGWEGAEYIETED